MKRLYELTRKSERCELCGVPLAARHEHLFDPKARKLACACQGCALILPSSANSRYRRVPDVREPIAIDASAWLTRLGVPVGVAAVLVHDDGRAVVGYPGAAGLVQSELDADVWRELDIALAPEVEALLLSTLATAGAWRVGIDVVFELVGELRASWQGITGGPGTIHAIERVLGGLA